MFYVREIRLHLVAADAKEEEEDFPYPICELILWKYKITSEYTIMQ